MSNKDYSWIVKNDEKIPGMHDYMMCGIKVQDLHEQAREMISKAKRKGLEIFVDDTALKESGMMSPYYEMTVVTEESQQLKERFRGVIDYFEEFDIQRERVEQAKKKLATGIVWGFWRESDGETCGLTEATEFTVQRDPAEGIPTYGTRQGYKSEVPEINWKLMEFTQTDVSYYVGAASFAEIDSVSRVPSYPNNVGDLEWALRVLHSKEDDEEFQRPLDLHRMQAIQDFVSEWDNRILNAVILFVPPESVEGNNPSVKLSKSNEDDISNLTINFENFLERHDDGVRRSWSQGNRQQDLRPLMLIDGQHRSRGGAISPTGKEKRVPIVVLPPDIGLSEVARIFTEINTGSDPLKDLQQLHLRHRFALTSANPEKDFRHWENLEKGRERQRCRANRISYELAANTCRKGALFNRIRMMDIGSGGSVISTNAKEFVKIAHRWFMKNGPFFDEAVDLDIATEVFGNYLSAWSKIATRDVDGMEEWEDSEIERWDPQVKKGVSGKPKNPYIAEIIPFKAVLMTFPLAFQLSGKLEGGRASFSAAIHQPTVDDFVKVLMPLQWLDWSQRDAIKQAYGLDKYTPIDLYNWFSWALEDYANNGVLHSRDEVWNIDSRNPDDCKPGRGFFSPVSSDLIRIYSSLNPGDEWPLAGEKIDFWSPSVPNACGVVQWQLNIDGSSTAAITKPTLSDGSIHRVDVTQQIVKSSQFVIDVFWNRSQSGRMAEPQAKATIRIEKDELGLIRIIGVDNKPIAAPELPDDYGELEALDEGEYVIGVDYGDGLVMAPPPANQLRQATGHTAAPIQFRMPYCQACEFGYPECKKQNCSFRDRYIPEA